MLAADGSEEIVELTAEQSKALDELIAAGKTAECPTVAKGQWQLGGFKSQGRWQNQMDDRAWTADQIDEAVQGSGWAEDSADNLVKRGSS